MKLKDMPGFVETMQALFEHFRKHGIQSSLKPLDDHDRLLRLLMESDLKSFSYSGIIEHYNVDFNGFHCDEDEVYCILFGNDDNPSANSILVDLSSNGSGFIVMTINSDRFIPLARGFPGDDGLMPVTVRNHDDGLEHVDRIEPGIMDDEEFADFLMANNRQGWLIRIEVD